MTPDEPGYADELRHHDQRGIGPLEHELTLHLERAHELSERARRANGVVQQDIDRARAIADELRARVSAAKE